MDPERAFDFLTGEWDAVCRVPAEDGSGWLEAPGRLSASRVLDGRVSLEWFEGVYHGGTVKGLGLRAYDRATGEWRHTWTDSLDPADFHVWKGVFRDDRIDLFAEWVDPGGQPVRSRLAWSEITPDSAHWESARSTDGGETWRLHWVIDLRRSGARKVPAD